jgi:hypothetical protein
MIPTLDKETRALGGFYTQPWPPLGEVKHHIAYVAHTVVGEYETPQEAADKVREAFTGLEILEINKEGAHTWPS